MSEEIFTVTFKKGKPPYWPPEPFDAKMYQNLTYRFMLVNGKRVRNTYIIEGDDDNYYVCLDGELVYESGFGCTIRRWHDLLKCKHDLVRMFNEQPSHFS